MNEVIINDGFHGADGQNHLCNLSLSEPARYTDVMVASRWAQSSVLSADADGPDMVSNTGMR